MRMALNIRRRLRFKAANSSARGIAGWAMPQGPHFPTAREPACKRGWRPADKESVPLRPRVQNQTRGYGEYIRARARIRAVCRRSKAVTGLRAGGYRKERAGFPRRVPPYMRSMPDWRCGEHSLRPRVQNRTRGYGEYIRARARICAVRQCSKAVNRPESRGIPQKARRFPTTRAPCMRSMPDWRRGRRAFVRALAGLSAAKLNASREDSPRPAF